MFKSLKSLFIVEEPATDQTAPKEIDNLAAASASRPTAPVMIPASHSPVAPDQRIFDSLQKALEDNNQPGFDFLEFKSSLQTLSGIIPDEATRYKSAFATAATLGVTTDKLLQSAAFYQGILERERNNFNQALSQQVDLNVTTQQKEVERLQALIGKKSEEIARLTQEITSHQQEMAKAQGVITEAQTKIESTKVNFFQTLDTVLHQIQRDVDNIKKYLN
ncbi:MAG: hypothetical protein V4714_22470 [Bacteroidota bacterium]